MAASRRNRPNGHYLVTTVQGGQESQVVATRAERLRLDPNAVDVQIDEPKRVVSIKHKGSTKSASYRPGDVLGFAVPEWDLLADIVFSVGDLLLLESDPGVNQKVRRIRRLFHDSKGEERFFKTTRAPYGIAINTELTWRYIETLAETDPKATQKGGA